LTALRLIVDPEGVEPALWLESLGGPPPALFPTWPPPEGHALVVVAVGPAAAEGVTVTRSVHVILDESRVEDFAAVEPAPCRKLFFFVPIGPLAAAVPAVGAAFGRAT
jgi:hypothetical protein